MQEFILNINGAEARVNTTPDTPLLWVIRENLNLTGTKYGCGKGLCGACTVHLNGSAVRSCSLPVGRVGKANITTIEGVPTPNLHVIQEVWIKHQVPQCGYCQSGQVMSVVALLSKNSQPDDKAIDAAMQGNICRCGTYPRIKRAIREAIEMNTTNTPGNGR